MEIAGEFAMKLARFGDGDLVLDRDVRPPRLHVLRPKPVEEIPA